MNPLVSVVVATKNEERNIANCLKSIKNQSYKNIELILVDNDSSDKTRLIAKHYTNKIYNLKDEVNLKSIKNFRGAQINFGVSISKGNLIFFPDADMTFDKDLIKEFVDKSKSVDAFYVPEIIIGKGFFGKIRNFERSFYNGTCIDAVRCVKRNLFNKIKGFDDKNIMFGPDDWDLTKRVRQVTNRIGLTKSKLSHHEESLSLKNYLEKKKKYTSTFTGYINKWGKEDPDVRKQLGSYYRLFGVLLEKGKWKRFLRHSLLALGLYYIRLRVAFNYLLQRKHFK